MKIDAFKELWFGSERGTFIDSKGRTISREVDEYSKQFHTICHNVRGFGSPHTISIVNTLLSRFIELGESYLEIGTFCGRSLIAGLQHNDIHAYVIDDHIARGETTDLAAEFDANVSKYGLQDRITLFRQDYRAPFTTELPKIGLYYFDGPHERWDSYDGIQLFKRFLSDNSIILVDDTDRPGVMADVHDWVKETPGAELIDVLNFSDGTAVIGYKRQ
jgi:predicted O-methyltransferase YrrM